MYKALGTWCFRHPWRVLGAWLATAVAVGVVAAGLGPSFGAEVSNPGSESGRAGDLLAEHFGSVGSRVSGTIVLDAIETTDGVNDPQIRAAMTALLAEIDAIDDVSVRSPYETGGAHRIASTGSAAGRIAYADIETDPGFNVDEAGALSADMEHLIEVSELRQIPGVQAHIGGSWLAEQAPPETEAIGLAFAIFVLIAAVGSVSAMGVTVGTALLGVGIGSLAIVILSNVATVPDFASTIGVMIGIGVGIDYALFIINRVREWRQNGLDLQAAVGAALDSAGRSVVFAGATVVLSLLGLLLIGLPFISGLGVSAAVTVAVVMAGSITVLPAVLGLLGERMKIIKIRGVIASSLVAVALLGFGLGIAPLLAGIPAAVAVVLAGSLAKSRNPLRRTLPQRTPKPLRDTAWYRLSRAVQARPWTGALGGFALLLLLAAPVLGLRLGFSDEGNFPADSGTRQAYDLLAEGFGPGANGPLLVVAETSQPDDLGTLVSLAGAINKTDGVAVTSLPVASPDGGAALIRIQPTTGPQDIATEELVQRLRGEVIPAALAGTSVVAHVGGAVAFGIDFSDYLTQRMLIFFAAVLGASFLLLTAVFRSLVVPLKAVVMNMLSIGAAYGVVVAIFQWGWLGSLFGIEGAPIEPFIPMMLFAILFGLSMDYEVFLLSRMKEEYERTGDPVNSVADGLASTARVITAAAAIMVVVFGSFVLEDNRIIKLFGFGLAAAIAFDATVVRMLIVPSTMELLGTRNWWLPAWLDRILPNLRVEGELSDRNQASAPEESAAQPAR